MDDTGNVTWRRDVSKEATLRGGRSARKLGNEERTKDGQADVDAEVGTTATLEKDTHGREDDGKEDFLVDLLVFEEREKIKPRKEGLAR